MELKEIIKGIEENGLYTFIANNYYKLGKEDLKNLLLEYDYSIYEKSSTSKELYNDIIKDIIKGLEIINESDEVEKW